jgi:hypothetical protein
MINIGFPLFESRIVFPIYKHFLRDVIAVFEFFPFSCKIL